MRNFCIIVYLLLYNYVPVASQCNGGSLFSSILKSSIDMRQKQVFELHSKGKESISMLIECIDNGEIAQIELDNPFSSNVLQDSPVYKGMIAAYLIELILSNSEITLKPFSEPDDSFICGDPMIYPYEYGRIIDVAKHKPISAKVLSNIKHIYEIWWCNNGKKTLDELRIEWKQGKRPLTNSKYIWN